MIFDKEMQKIVLEKSCFRVHGRGIIQFTGEHGKQIFLEGEILIARNSFYQDIYVQVSSKGKDFLMPVENVSSIKWGERTIE